MTFNYKYLLIFGVFSSLLTILFVGQFYDHHGDRTLFIKHRPTFRQMFSIPHKEYLPAAKQTAAEKAEESENEEFLLEQNLRESHGEIFFPSVLIQISIMLLISGCFSFYRKVTLSFWQLIIQFSINILITLLAVLFMLWDDNATTSTILFMTIVVTNYLTIVIQTRVDNYSKVNNLEINSTTNSGAR